MSLDIKIARSERLYRAIKRSKPGWLDYGKPTSAMFRDHNGVSVDRDGKRTEAEIESAFRTSFGARLKGIAMIYASACYDTGADVKPSPTEENPYHANIWLDMNDRKREMLQAYRLASAATIVYIDDAVEWIQ